MCQGRVGGVPGGVSAGRVGRVSGACRGACRGRVGGVSGRVSGQKLSNFKLFSNRKSQFRNYLPENASIFNISTPKQPKTPKKNSETDRTALECQFFHHFDLFSTKTVFRATPGT